MRRDPLGGQALQAVLVADRAPVRRGALFLSHSGGAYAQQRRGKRDGNESEVTSGGDVHRDTSRCANRFEVRPPVRTADWFVRAILGTGGTRERANCASIEVQLVRQLG
jgi:hypothetical protein